MVFLDGQELGIPVHYASEEADNTRLGTSGPAVRAIVKETGVPWDGNWMWADDNVNNVTWLHHLMLHPKTSKFEKFECVDHVLTMC
jgi:hypothetical protein